MDQSQCLFCRISAKQLPADILFEDENLVAFKDIHPKAPVHILVIPRKHIRSLAEVGESDTELLGLLLQVIKKAAHMTGVEADGGQEVDHLHLHLLGGEPLGPMRA
jgi:histidine triad (HIT) family protein